VNVIGYGQLVDRLAAAGPRPGWDDGHWDALAWHLGMYRDCPESREAKARREDLAAVDDYRHRS